MIFDVSRSVKLNNRKVLQTSTRKKYYTYKGKTYKSLISLAHAIGISYRTLRTRIDKNPNLSIEEIFSNTDNRCQYIIVNNKSFKSIAEACRYYNKNINKIRMRLKNNWSIEEAFDIIERIPDKCNGTIYRITNTITGLVYIGLTTQSLKNRFQSHKTSFMAGDKNKLYSAMREYGIKNFTIKAIAYSDSIKELIILEKKYIEKYDSIKNGYNSMAGGNVGKHSGTSVTHEGIIYKTKLQLIEKLKTTRPALDYRLRQGLDLTQPVRLKQKSVMYKGVLYPSMKALADYLGVNEFMLRNRIHKNIPIDFKKPIILYRGKYYETIQALAIYLNLSWHFVRQRFVRGYCLNGKTTDTGKPGFYTAQYVEV